MVYDFFFIASGLKQIYARLEDIFASGIRHICLYLIVLCIHYTLYVNTSAWFVRSFIIKIIIFLDVWCEFVFLFSCFYLIVRRGGYIMVKLRFATVLNTIFEVRHEHLKSATDIWCSPRTFEVRHEHYIFVTNIWNSPRTFEVRYK